MTIDFNCQKNSTQITYEMASRTGWNIKIEIAYVSTQTFIENTIGWPLHQYWRKMNFQ